MSRQARLRRDLCMTVESASGSSHQQIAQRHGVSTKTVQRAIMRARGAGSDVGSDSPGGLLSDHWLKLEQAKEDLALARIGAANDRTRVAATRLQTALMREQWNMLLQLGLVPSTRDHRELRKAIGGELRGTILAAARQDGLSAEMQTWLDDATGDFAAK